MLPQMYQDQYKCTSIKSFHSVGRRLVSDSKVICLIMEIEKMLTGESLNAVLDNSLNICPRSMDIIQRKFSFHVYLQL